MLQYLDKNGFGTKKKMNGVYAKLSEREKINMMLKGAKTNTTLLSQKDELIMTSTAAQGFSVQVGSSSTTTDSDWPLFTHLLPEMAMAGHSNSGKSTLVNALTGRFGC